MASRLVVPELPAVQLTPEAHGLDRLLTRLGSTIDAVVLRGMQLVTDAALAPAPADLPQLRASALPFLDGALVREPRRFFAFLDAPPPEVTVTSRYRRSLSGGVAIAREFPSRYVPFDPARESDAAACPENARIPVEHWMHEPGPPAGTVVALHGFAMGRPRLDAFALHAPAWYEHGLDVALLTLPFHGARAPASARFSGELFASPDVGRLNEAVRQAVHDVRLVCTWLRQHRRAPVGLMGLSLGSYVAALLAGLLSDLDFVVAMVPPVCLGDLAWRFFERSRRYRSGVQPPLTRDELRTAYRVHSPLSYPLSLSRDRALIVAGRGDLVVPPEHPQALWRHWGEPAVHWFSGSHTAPFRRSRIVAAVASHLRALGIL